MVRCCLLLTLIGGIEDRSLFAHGDVHEAIVALTQRIEASPQDAELYLQRGSLHRVHQDWAAAAADFDRAAKLNPELKVVDLARGDSFAEQARWAEASEAISRYITARSDDPRGWSTRGRISAAQGKWKEAAEDFGHAVRVAKELEPQLVLDQVRALRESGREAEALPALDAAMGRLGPLVVLVQPAIELEERAGKIDSALDRLEKAMAAAPRKERWLAQKGELLERVGRVAEAKESFEQALKKFEELPNERRRVAAMAAFEQKVRGAIARLSPVEGTDSK